MAIISQHPSYKSMLPDWETMRDTYAGERAVKERGEKYLAPTAGMVLDGMAPGQLGYSKYNNYRSRAIFHDFVRDGVEYYIGLMHQKPPAINLPKALEPMRDDATIEHEGIEQLLRKINEQQLVAGRYGMMLDIPKNPDPAHPMPYIATYNAEAITNWDTGTRGQIDIPELNLVVLNESTFRRTSEGFEWEWVQQYRVLVLGDDVINEEKGLYRQALFVGQEAQYNKEMLEAPSIRGKTLEHIPFVFINAQDNLPTPDLAPMMGLAKLSLAVYRGEADYRQNLFMQGQDTLVVIGGKDDDIIRTGAGSTINLRAGSGVDAKFIGVTATGLSEQREALENDKVAARNKSGQLIDARSKQKESGEALTTRVSAQTATLNQIAFTGGRALEQLLKAAAEWVGADPEEVSVEVNTEFADQPFLAADLVALMTAKNLGAPLSLETIHTMMLERGMTELEFEQEMDKMADEAPTVVGTDAGGNPVDDAGQSLDPETGKPIAVKGKLIGKDPNDPEAKPNTPAGKAAAKAKAAKANAKKPPAKKKK